MSTDTKQITVTITGSPNVILRIERFLALLHLSSIWGHSCTAAMDLDGDGSEKVRVSGIDVKAHSGYIEHVTRRPRTKSVDWVGSGYDFSKPSPYSRVNDLETKDE